MICVSTIRSRRAGRAALGAAVLLALICAQSGCNACWEVRGSPGAPDWGCDSGFSACGSGEAALLVGAIYLAIAIPYLIAEACRACN